MFPMYGTKPERHLLCEGVSGVLRHHLTAQLILRLLAFEAIMDRGWGALPVLPSTPVTHFICFSSPF